MRDGVKISGWKKKNKANTTPMKFFYLLLFFIGTGRCVVSQRQWVNVDEQFGKMPASFHVYKSTDSLDGKPFIAFYSIAKLKNKAHRFETDTTTKRRLTPTQFYEKNNHPLLVVNASFFSFSTHQNLNLVIKQGEMVGYNIHTIPMKGKDTLQYRHPLGSALGISKKGKADIAWLLTDSSTHYPLALQFPVKPIKDSFARPSNAYLQQQYLRLADTNELAGFKQWKMYTAVGGGPVLLQQGKIHISNNEELKFAGKAIDDKHPRTAIGYTADGYLIIMVIQGRFPGKAEGATLTQTAALLKELGCIEAINLDGGGSSAMLINGKPTILPSDKEGERMVPGVLMITSSANK